MRVLAKVLVFILLLVPAAALVAQQTSYEVKRGTVVSVFNDQLVVKLPSGEVKQLTVPAGFKFTVDGREVGLADLTPGTELTAVIKTTKTPETVRTTTVRNGEVVRVVGSTLTYREDGQVKTVTVPSGFKFNVDGKQVGISELRPGYKLTAEVVTTSEKIETSRDLRVGGTTPPPPPAPAPAYVPPPAPEPAAAPAELPATASPLPLIGLAGLLMAATGFAIRRK
jgi:hypothetical protein